MLELEAHKVAVERLGIELRYRGPYIHVGDRLTKLLYSTNPVACVYLHYACDTPVTQSAGSCDLPGDPWPPYRRLLIGLTITTHL